jgi:hypothetical protein
MSLSNATAVGLGSGSTEEMVAQRRVERREVVGLVVPLRSDTDKETVHLFGRKPGGTSEPSAIGHATRWPASGSSPLEVSLAHPSAAT